MNKVFNASLLATAVAMSFGANAATILVDPANTMTLSEEGVSVGVTEAATAIIFDTVLAADHSGTTEIVVTFGSAVDLTALAAGPSTCGAPVTGTFACGDVTFNVGNGNFTFDAVTVDAVAGTLTYTVSLGNTITAGSSYRTTVGKAGAFPVISDAFSADFESTLASAVVDSGTGIIATTSPQFAAVISKETDGTIERAARFTFTNPETAGITWATFAVDVTNDTTLLAQPTVADSVITTEVDLTDASIHAVSATDGWGVTSGTLLIPATAGVVNGTFDNTIAAATFAADFTETYTFNITAALTAPNVLEVSDFDTDLTLNFSGPAGPGTKVLLSKADAGDWILDAAVINVPYLPVGYGLTPNVEIANDSAVGTMSEVIIEGFDDKGNVLGPVTLPMTADGKTVTKVSEADIMTAFGITKGKLSVTFIIDADKDKVTLAPYYRQNESRVNVITDQYKADGIR